ncbi:YggT family protein [Neptunomonas japonica]|uniref:YggT family protein n=1 Tax=Neptunomonas japonica JAMM 1380 TaxID=1441457 RepID=A0A7R6PPX7_9GAMM|nr:YggT family protein [Neptunomonas japonica]BBB28235.1 YggT family protein [Neptunomonas japonica JAMM 1380]
MGQDPIILIIRTLGELFIFILLMRFLLQLARADYYNPISQSIVRLTQPMLAPLQKILPKAGRMDLSPLAVALIVKLGIFAALIMMAGGNVQADIVSLVIYAVVGLLDSILNIYFWAVIGSVIISWVAPGSYHPAPQLIGQITEPLFKLAQKVIPPLGGLDLSPILIFLTIQIIQSQLARLVM